MITIEEDSHDEDDEGSACSPSQLENSAARRPCAGLGADGAALSVSRPPSRDEYISWKKYWVNITLDHGEGVWDGIELKDGRYILSNYQLIGNDEPIIPPQTRDDAASDSFYGPANEANLYLNRGMPVVWLVGKHEFACFADTGT